MLLTWFLCIIFHLLCFNSTLVSSRAAPIVSHVPLRHGNIDLANVSNTIWPPCPYKVIIPKRLGTPFILVTKNDRRDHGYRAKLLAIAVCHQMSDWIQKLPQSSEIKEVHWEHNSQGDEYAVEHSIYLSLDPIYPHGNLERELAYFAIEELRSLVFTYGAMEGVFEIWSRKTKRAVGTFHIFKWPEMNNTLGSSHTIQK